jgi:hypothetical protein
MPTPLTGVRADQPQSYRNLERVAAFVREKLNFQSDEAIGALRLFDNLDNIRIEPRSGRPIPLGYGVVELADSEGYVKYDSERHIIEVLASEDTYCWLEHGHPRGGYFVAHELGHCLLHTDQLLRLAKMPTAEQAAFHRLKTEHKPYEDTEWQANAFASALLMPAVGLIALEKEHGAISVTEIAERFGVSNEAAGYRLELFAARRRDLTGS